MMRITKYGLGLAAVLVLSGCGHIPVSTMISLRNFDFATFDPAVLRVAVRSPDWLETRPGGAKLNVGLWTEGREKEKQVETFVLAENNTPSEAASLSRFRQTGARMLAFRVADADVARIRALQTEARNGQRQPGAKRHLEVSIDVDTCHRGDVPPGPIYSTTFLKPDAATAYLVFLADVDLRKAAADAGKSLVEVMPACGKFNGRAN
jgi:hypothetical protein